MPSIALPRWRSHKVVEGFKIAAIEYFDGGGAKLVSSDPLCYVEVQQAYLDRYLPEVGMYYARYKDGYQSVSPADAWEAGNTLLDTADQPFGLDKETIKAIFLEHGFKCKSQLDGSDDLNPYVYTAATALLERALATTKK